MNLNVTDLDFHLFITKLNQSIEDIKEAVKELSEYEKATGDEYIKEALSHAKESDELFKYILSKMDSADMDDKLKYIGLLSIKIETLNIKFDSLMSSIEDEDEEDS